MAFTVKIWNTNEKEDLCLNLRDICLFKRLVEFLIGKPAFKNLKGGNKRGKIDDTFKLKDE